jgi:hypothetical protein
MELNEAPNRDLFIQLQQRRMAGIVIRPAGKQNIKWQVGIAFI